MVFRSIATTACLLLGLQAQPAKRLLTVNDFDSWRSTASQQISADGKWLAYSVFPQVGNGEVVLVDLATKKETRIPSGALPIREAVDPNAEPSENPPAAVPGPRLEFTSDGNYMVFLAFPPKAEIDVARKAKKKPEDMPKNSLAIVSTATGAIFTSGQVKSAGCA